MSCQQCHSMFCKCPPPSIMVEDYQKMEELMKRFLLLAPQLAGTLYGNVPFQVFNQFNILRDDIQSHLES